MEKRPLSDFLAAANKYFKKRSSIRDESLRKPSVRKPGIDISGFDELRKILDKKNKGIYYEIIVSPLDPSSFLTRTEYEREAKRVTGLLSYFWHESTGYFIDWFKRAPFPNALWDYIAQTTTLPDQDDFYAFCIDQNIFDKFTVNIKHRNG